MTTKKQTPSQILAHKRALKVAQQQRYQAKLTARARASTALMISVQELRSLITHNLDAKTQRDWKTYLDKAERAMQAAMEAGVA